MLIGGYAKVITLFKTALPLAQRWSFAVAGRLVRPSAVTGELPIPVGMVALAPLCLGRENDQIEVEDGQGQQNSNYSIF